MVPSFVFFCSPLFLAAQVFFSGQSHRDTVGSSTRPSSHTHIGARIGRGDTAVTRARVPREQRMEAQEDEEIKPSGRRRSSGKRANESKPRARRKRKRARRNFYDHAEERAIDLPEEGERLASEPPPPLSRFPFSLVRILTYRSPSLPLCPSLPAPVPNARSHRSRQPVIAHVFSFLDARSLGRSSAVCTHWRSVVLRFASSLWKRIPLDLFPPGSAEGESLTDRHHPRPV